MKKSNKLSVLLLCVMLVLAMLGGVAFTEGTPAPCESPCACCHVPVIEDTIAEVIYNGKDQVIATITVDLSFDDLAKATVKVDGAVAAPASENARIFTWQILAKDAGVDHKITVTTDALVDNVLKGDYQTKEYTAKVLPAQVTITLPDEITYYYHEKRLENQDYLQASHAEVKGVVEGESIKFELAADVKTNDAGAIAVNEAGYPWYIVVDAAQDANYTITANHEAGTPAKLIVAYLSDVPQAAVRYADPSNQNIWHNAANKAIIDAPEGYTLSKELDGDYTASITDLDDIGEDENGLPLGIGKYFLENIESGARTAEMETSNTYKQDTIAPVVPFEAKLESSITVSATDENSGLAEVSLLVVNGERVTLARNLMADSKFQNGALTNYSETIKVVGTLSVTVKDAAGNITVQSTDIFASDSDGDGLNNTFENLFGTAYTLDYDGDGLTDGMEELTGYSDFRLYDTDGDGLNDGLEYQLGLNARRPDSDNDGVSDPDYLRYLEAMGLTDLDIELGMMLMQSNLTRANNLPVVPAADLVMLKDSTFQMDNGQDAGASYSVLENRKALGDQLRRSNKNFYMLRFDERDGIAVYLTAVKNTYYIVMAEINRGNLSVISAYELPYDVSVGNIAAATSADGTIVALAPWANDATAQNILLVNMTTGEQFRFGGVADTMAATRFTLADDGSVLAYVGSDKLLHTINMTKEEYVDTDYAGNALHYMADGQLLTNVDETAPNGVYHVEQPTIHHVALVLVDDGVLTPLEITGRFFYSNYALRCSIEGLRRDSDGIRLHDLYTKLAAKKN